MGTRDTEEQRERTDTETPRRDIPDEQRPDGELDDPQIRTYEEAAKLARHFEEIETATIGEDTFRAPVKAIESGGRHGKVAIEVDVPAEDGNEQFHLDKPKVWTDRFRFVRWVEGHGYTAGDFQLMIEKQTEVEVRRDNGEYELVIPDPDAGRLERGVTVARALRSEVSGRIKVAAVSAIVVYLLTMALIASVVVDTGFLGVVFVVAFVGVLPAFVGLLVGIIAHGPPSQYP